MTSRQKRFKKIFKQLAAGSETGPATLKVMMGRTLAVPMASRVCAMFNFADLCERNLGAADYIAIAQQYKYVIVSDIPILTFDQREKIRRFITLFDVFYENGIRFICSAEETPQKLFVPAKRENYGGNTATDNGGGTLRTKRSHRAARSVD